MVPILAKQALARKCEFSNARMTGNYECAIVGSHFIKLLEANNYSEEAATDYVATFKKELNA